MGLSMMASAMASWRPPLWRTAAAKPMPPQHRCTPHRISSIKATGTFRAQGDPSFRAASKTFGQLAGLMDQQTDLLECAGTLMRIH